MVLTKKNPTLPPYFLWAAAKEGMCYFPKLFSSLPFRGKAFPGKTVQKSCTLWKEILLWKQPLHLKKNHFITFMLSFFQTTFDIWDKSLQFWPEICSLVSVCSFLPPCLHFPSPFPEKFPCHAELFLLSASSLAQHAKGAGKGRPRDFQQLQSHPRAFFF